MCYTIVTELSLKSFAKSINVTQEVKLLQDYAYQDDAVAEILKILYEDDEDSALLVSATGSGKTVMVGKAIRKILARTNMPVLSIVNLQALVGQTYCELMELGIKVSVVHNEITSCTHKGKEVDFVMGWGGDVVITMPETIRNCILGESEFAFDDKFLPCLLWIDEAHKGTSEIFQFIRDYYEDAKILGSTATPYRENNKEGEHIREWYEDRWIKTISVQDLIDMGRLVQPVYSVYEKNDNVVSKWRDIMGEKDNKATVLFTPNADASISYLKAFTDAGIKAEIITSGSDIVEVDGEKLKPQTVKERNEIYKKFDEGEITVLISIRALCEGWNCERAVCCILARGVGTPALYDQMIGRVMRSWRDKDGNILKNNCYVLDFGNNVTDPKLGRVEDRDWDTIGDGREIAVTKSGSEMTLSTFNDKRVVYHVCDNCHHVYDLKTSMTCTNTECGNKSSVRITDTVKDIFKSYFDTDSKVQIANIVSFCKRLPKMKDANSIAIAAYRNNLKYGHDIFNEEGELTDEFSFISQLYDKKTIQLTAKIAVR